MRTARESPSRGMPCLGAIDDRELRSHQKSSRERARIGQADDVRPARDPSPESLTGLLGGGRSALDATAPAVAFGLGWILAERSLAWGAGAALVTGAVLAA
ncbi:MAG: hypothetical protein LC799_31700, partial [Actinobacteria bacterium]|nr:hypothetical protein [Actinomycetota bacterium]